MLAVSLKRGLFIKDKHGAAQPLQTAFMPSSYHPIPTSPQCPLGPRKPGDRAQRTVSWALHRADGKSSEGGAVSCQGSHSQPAGPSSFLPQARTWLSSKDKLLKSSCLSQCVG